MKRFKLICMMLCVSVLCACVGLFAACGDLFDPSNGTTEYYTVTAQYDEEGGTVELTPSASEKGYVKDEQVTVTVTANLYYTVKEVKVNDAAVELTEGKYSFKVGGNTTVSATFEYNRLQGTTWTNDTLGDLVIDAEGNMTLDGEAVTVLTEGVDFSAGLPDEAIEVKVGETTYTVTFDDYITFNAASVNYVFDSEPEADFSAFAGTWVQCSTAAELVVTAEGMTYQNKTYTEYYTTIGGEFYVRDGNWRYIFGFVGNDNKVFSLAMGSNLFFFTEDGELPVAAFPEAFYGKWQHETLGELVISAAGASIGLEELEPFAIDGEGEKAVVHLYYNGNYVTVRLRKNAENATELVLWNGRDNVFSFVLPEPLPQEYHGSWKQLGGDATVTVGDEGDFQYQNKKYNIFHSASDFYYFTNDEGYDSTVEVSYDGYVLWIYVETTDDITITYFAKDGTLPDVEAMGAPVGNYASSNGTLTVSADHKLTYESEAIQLLTWEAETEVVQNETVTTGYIGGAIFGDAWCSVKYNIATGTITINSAEMGELTFTLQGGSQGGGEGGGGQGGGGTQITIPVDFNGTWAEHNGLRKQMAFHDGTISFGTPSNMADVTATAQFTGSDPSDYVLTFTAGQTEYTCKFVTEVGAPQYYALVVSAEEEEDIFLVNSMFQGGKVGEALYNTTWKDGAAYTLKIDGDGKITENIISDALILSYSGADPVQWTMIIDGVWYKATVSGDTIAIVDYKGTAYHTVTKEESAPPATVDIPEDFRGTWVMFGGQGPQEFSVAIGQSSVAMDGEAITEIEFTGNGADGTLSFKVSGALQTCTLTKDVKNAHNAIVLNDGENNFFYIKQAVYSSGGEEIANEDLLDTSWKNGDADITVSIKQSGVTVNGEEAFILSCDDAGDTVTWTMLVTLTEMGAPKYYWYHAVYDGSFTLMEIDEVPIEMTEYTGSSDVFVPEGMAGTWYDLEHDTYVAIDIDGISLPETGNEKMSGFTSNADEQTITMSLGGEATVTITLLDKNTIEVKIVSSEMTQTSYYFGSALFSQGSFNGGLSMEMEGTFNSANSPLGTLTFGDGVKFGDDNYAAVTSVSEGAGFTFILNQGGTMKYYTAVMDMMGNWTITERGGQSYTYTYVE